MIRMRANEERRIDGENPKLHDNFHLKFSVCMDTFREGAGEKLFSVFFRKQTSYIANWTEIPDDIGIDAYGDLRYILTVCADGSVGLYKAFERSRAEIVNEDGVKVSVPRDINDELGTGRIGVSPGKAVEIELMAERGSIRVIMDGVQLFESVNKYYYASGYITFMTYHYSMEIQNVTLEPIPTVLHIAEIVPTPLFARGNPLKQLVKLQLDNRLAGPLHCFAAVSMDGLQAGTEELSEIAPGQAAAEIYIPDAEKECRLKVELYAEGDHSPLSSFEKDWQPQKKWSVHLFVSAHEDLGYCDYVTQLRSNLAGFIDLARQICDSVNDKEDKYRYVIEHMWWLFGYAEERSTEKFKSLLENYLKKGYMETIAVHSGTHTHWNGYEQLARSTYYARREAKDRWNIDSPTALYGDTPGISWSCAEVFPKAGIKYVINSKGPWRKEKQSPRLPELFYWVGPNGKDEILHYWRWHYHDKAMYRLLKGGYNMLLDGIAGYLDAKRKYPYDAVLTSLYCDHEYPNMLAIDVIQRWNRKWAYPAIQMSTPAEYFTYMEKKYGPVIPRYSGDINDGWADYATIDPISMGKKRECAALFPVAESLSVLARTVDAKYEYPYKAVYDILWRMMEFDEHCWATMLPPTFMNILNNDIMKKGNIAEAHKKAQQALDHAVRTLNANIALPEPYNIVVWNYLQNTRTDTVELDLSGIPYPTFEIRENTGGQTVAWQKLSVEKAVFIAENIPAFGYKTYTVLPTEKAGGAFAKTGKEEGCSAFTKAGGEEEDGAFTETDMNAISAEPGVNTISNEYYTITCDPAYGTIESIFDKELGRELLDSSSSYKFNQYLFVTTEDKLSPELKIWEQKNSKLAAEVGPLASRIRITAEEPVSGAEILQDIVLYKGIKRIDITNRQLKVDEMLYKGSLGKNYGDVGNRYLGNVFYAFPFQVENFRMNTEFAGGVVEDSKDRLPMGVKDYIMAQNWVDLGNEEFGTALYTREAPTIHPGKIMYNRFDMEHKPEISHLFVYAASNRMAGLNTRTLDDCSAAFHFSLYSHAGGWSEGGVPQWSWKKLQPLTAFIECGPREGKLPPVCESFLTTDRGNVQLTAMKHSEKPGKGIVLRFVETNGTGCTVKVRLPFMKVRKAWLTTLVEDDTEKLSRVTADEIEFYIDAYDYATLRVEAEAEALPGIEDLGAVEAKDRSVKLGWKGSDAYGFNIYRSTEADFKPLIYNRQGYTAENTYMDEGLDPDTEYYYRIAAVDRWNNEGPVNGVLAVKTDTLQLSAPAPVEEVHVVTGNSSTLILWWKSCSNKDVAGYEIHRSEQPGFTPCAQTLVCQKAAEPYFKHFYTDEGLAPDTTYYYAVRPVDVAGNVQEAATCVEGRTA